MAVGTIIVGCGSGGQAVHCPGGAPTVEIGTGASRFVPLADGDPAFVFCGPQGGRHVLVRIRGSGLSPPVVIDATLEDEATSRQLAHVDVPAATFHGEGSACVSDLYRVFVGPPTPEIDGVAGRLQVHVVDAAGLEAAAQRRVVVDGSTVTCGL